MYSPQETQIVKFDHPGRPPLSVSVPLSLPSLLVLFVPFTFTTWKVDVRDQERCRRKRGERQFEAWEKCRPHCQAVIDMAIDRCAPTRLRRFLVGAVYSKLLVCVVRFVWVLGLVGLSAVLCGRFVFVLSLGFVRCLCVWRCLGVVS